MSQKKLKFLTIAFIFNTVGIAVCLGMTVYTGIYEHHEKELLMSRPVPLPAIPAE